jgi:hypothetical protein
VRGIGFGQIIVVWLGNNFFAGPGIICLLAFAPVVAEETNSPTNKITAIRNQVSKSGVGTHQNVDVGHVVKSGESVVTGDQGLAELQSRDSTTIRVGEKSTASYDSQQRKVILQRGTLLVNAPPDGDPLKIEVGGVTYTVDPKELKLHDSKVDSKERGRDSRIQEKSVELRNNK